jgi:aryl-phospho-beta-D-glucosidase BglC (GH1 family)
MHLPFVLLAAFLAPASAWMPGLDRQILARDGQNLFNSSDYYSNTTKRWLPGSGKIRGVNTGSMFVFEPWLGSTAWANMGCGDVNSEFDCVVKLGQTQANAVFQAHWNTWITQADIAQMQSYGLNAIRIQVGYWMLESLPFPGNEFFPQGGLAYLERLCGWATAAGFYIMIDLHGAPGAQVAQNSDTGQYAPTPGFYVDWEFDRATTFLNWLTTQIHTNSNFNNVGLLGIVNEPVQDQNSVTDLRSYYYPNAYAVSNLSNGSSNSTNFIIGNPFRRSRSRDNRQQLSPRANDERRMGLGRSNPISHQQLLRSIRRPPLSQVGTRRSLCQPLTSTLSPDFLYR